MRVLIVDDEEQLARMLKDSLEREGYAVDYLTDGEAALRRVETFQNEYDLMILDWMLPGVSGIEVCKNLRSQNIPMPILVLTARPATEDKVTALNTGADDYLVKPFAFNELLARIRALLRRPPEALSPELAVGTLSLNAATRKAKRGEREIILTIKEFALLEYLMRHVNHVVTRDQIRDHIWGFDFDSFSNVIDVHVKNIRKKMKLKEELITVRGIGYTLKA